MIVSPAQSGLPEDPHKTKKAAGPAATPQDSNNSKNNNKNQCAWQLSPEPWGEPVCGSALLDELRDTFLRHLILPDHAAATLALWVIHTYSFELGDITAYLAILSPEKRCGKTTALTLVSKLCHKALPASNVSPAAVFRVIEEYSPTLLVDEADTFVAGKEELGGILNAGFNRETAYTLRCHGDDHNVKQYNLYAPKLFAGIGKLPDTLGDRCIIVPMRRKLPGETVERLRGDLDGSDFRSKCMRWTNDNSIEIKFADPEVPEQLDDRASDIWRPLLAIADLAGGAWPEDAHQAAVELSGNKDDDESINIQLLKDIRDHIVANNLDRLKTEELLDHLYSLEERPWNTFYRGREMNPRQLADRLKSFGINSKTIRFGSGTAKGYMLEDMIDAFNRYTY
jgi:putative DNA primase/helicase